MDLILVFAFALAGGSIALFDPAPAAITALVLAVVAVSASRRRYACIAVCAIGLCIGYMRTRAAVVHHEDERQLAAASLPRIGRCTARATVVSQPVVTHGVYRWDGSLRDVECEGAASSWTGVASLYGGPRVARGDEVAIIAQLAAPERYDNVELGDARAHATLRGVVRSGSLIDGAILSRSRSLHALIDHARDHVRRRIEATFPADTAPMARALVLGEMDIDADDSAAFRASGLSHLLAVSGMHLILVVLTCVRVLSAIFARIERIAASTDIGRLAAAIGIVLAWAYADFAGGSGSAIRAAFMLSVSLGARVLRREPDAPRSFALSVACGCVSEPLAMFDISFLLSVAATGGLVAFSAPIAHVIAARLPARLHVAARAIAATLAATIPCAPIIAKMAPSVPAFTVATNLVAGPIGETAALPLCLAHATLAPLPSAEYGVAVVASGALHTLKQVARGAARLPAVPVPTPTRWQLAVMVIALALVLRLRGRPRWVSLACAVLVLGGLEALARRPAKGTLRVTFLDVGQGDAALIDFPDGTAMLVDGGGTVGSPVDVGQRVIAPVLRARRRASLRAVVLSHPHPDHFGGLATGLNATRVGELWDTGQGEAEGVSGGYATLLSAMHMQNTPILRPRDLCGRHTFGSAIVEVLAPCPAPSTDRSPNDNSFVLRITYGVRSILLVGDAEHEEEATLLQGGRDLHADVLKVGHHGSRTSSTPSFVNAVEPSVAVISCGIRNRFGHPHQATLATLAHVKILRTDEVGEVIVVTDGSGLDVTTASTY